VLVPHSCQAKTVSFASSAHLLFAVFVAGQESTEYATPAGRRVPRDVPASAFRNVSYQRATHESLMGDSVEHQSPADDATAAAIRGASSVTDASDVDRTTVEHSEVKQLTRCFLF